MSASATAAPAQQTAQQRMAALLSAQARAAGPAPDGGYLDVLGDAAPLPTGAAQRLMLSDVVPAIYERWWRPALTRAAKGPRGPSMADEYGIAAALLELGPGDGVLDVACGPGNFTRSFARAVGDLGLAVGIDASPTMLARAVRDSERAGERAVAFVRGDATALPFRDAAFDAACCFAALHLFAEPLAALRELARVLTPGGRLALLTSCATRIRPPVRPRSLAGMRVFAHDEIAHALRGLGFEDIAISATGVTQFVSARRG